MSRVILIDTGPLVALLCAQERRHAWVVEQLSIVPAPLLTCEAVLSEADHLLRRVRAETGLVLELLRRGVLSIDLNLAEQAAAVARIQAKYRDVPASLADACLVRLSELRESCAVLTFDSDFRIYRRNGRQAIPLLSPAD